MKKSNEVGVMIVTIISALLFCSLLIMISLSPLAESGPNANEFGSLGMWSAAGVILVLYILPLIIYKVGVTAMRYIMAIFCGIGILINVASMGIVLLINLKVSHFPYLAEIIGISIAAVIVNIIWFFVAFLSSKKPSVVLSN